MTPQHQEVPAPTPVSNPQHQDSIKTRLKPPGLTPAQAAVLYALAQNSDPKTLICSSNQRSLSQAVGYCRMSVWRALKHLEALGILLRLDEPGHRARWRLKSVTLPQPKNVTLSSNPSAEEGNVTLFPEGPTTVPASTSLCLTCVETRTKANTSTSLLEVYDKRGADMPTAKPRKKPQTPEQMSLVLLGVETAPPTASPVPETHPIPPELATALADYWKAMRPGSPVPFGVFGLWYRKFLDAAFILDVVSSIALRGAVERVGDKLTGYIFAALTKEWARRQRYAQGLVGVADPKALHNQKQELKTKQQVLDSVQAYKDRVNSPSYRDPSRFTKWLTEYNQRRSGTGGKPG